MALPDYPHNRLERYLAVWAGQAGAVIPAHPNTRIERYLAVICKQVGATLPAHPTNRLERYLAAIAGQTGAIAPAYPYTRLERFLAAILGDADAPEYAFTRAELYLLEISQGFGSRWVPAYGIKNGSNTSIDTGIKAQDNIELYARAKVLSGSFYLLQARQTNESTIYGISGSESSGSIGIFGVTSRITRTSGHIYTLKGTLANGSVTIYVKDETDGTEDTKTETLSAQQTLPSPTTIKLFGDASKINSGTTVYRAYIKINGAMAWDMYPAVDVLDDNKAVAYDAVSKKPSNVLSGSITVGTVIQPVAYANIPLGGYVEFDVTNTQDTRWLADMKSDVTSGTPWIGGFREYIDGNSHAKQTVQVSSTSGIVYIQYSDNPEVRVDMPEPFSSKDRHIYEWNANKTLIDGTVVNTETAETFTGTEKLKIGAIQSLDVLTVNFTGNCYKVQCWKDGVNQDVDAIPVRLGETVEMLDLVNWTFASRTGDFTAGPDIPWKDVIR